MPTESGGCFLYKEIDNVLLNCTSIAREVAINNEKPAAVQAFLVKSLDFRGELPPDNESRAGGT